MDNKIIWISIFLIGALALIGACFLTPSEVEANNGGINVIECPSCHLRGYEDINENYMLTIQISANGDARSSVNCYCQKCGNLWRADTGSW